jgi:hypothetical protein
VRARGSRSAVWCWVPAGLGLESEFGSGKKTAPIGGARLSVRGKKGDLRERVLAGPGKETGLRGGRRKREVGSLAGPCRRERGKKKEVQLGH